MHTSSLLKIFYFNARSLLPKLDELRLLTICHSPDVICIVESWLAPDILDSELTLPGYTVFRLDRNRHGGGVAVYVRSSLSPSVLFSSDSLEFLIVSLTSHNRPLCIGTFYRPPSSPQDISILSRSLSTLPVSTLSKLLLIGDFNVNYSQPSSSPLYAELISLSNSYSLDQIISEPTHHSHSGTPSTIDLVFIPSTLTSEHSILPPVLSSDHASILISLHLPKRSRSPTPPNPTRRRIWLYKQADLPLMAQLFESTDWDALLSPDLDHSWSSFKSHFLSIMNTCIPTKLLPLHPLPPWISRSISSKIRKRHHLYQRAKSSSSPTVMASYRSLRNSIRSQLKKDKSTFFSSLSSAPPSKFWLFVKSLRKNPSNIPPLSSNGSVINSDADKATCLNHFFTSCQNATMPPLSPIPPLNLTSGCPDEFLCTEEEIAVLIRSLASNTAPGPDLITTKMLKAATPFITYPLCYIFNLSLSLGLVPLDWKTSSVIPIPKTSPPSNSPNNFRPISLLSIISKLLEKHIHSILLHFSLSHNLLSPLHFGFLPNRSTTTALIHSTHSIFSLLETYPAVCGVFLDLRKAFDSVPHIPLLDLLSSVSLPPHLLNWIHSYLLNRSQRVVVNGQMSPPLPISSGVPQGSILGPLLFILYINGLTNLPLSPSTQLILYADDIFLFHPISSHSDLSSLQSDLDTISTWLSSKSLQLNSSKSKYIYFSRKSPSCFDSFPSLSLLNVPLNRVPSFCYLGVTLTASLSWSTHILSTCRKARKILGLIFRHFYPHSSYVSTLPLSALI